MDYLFAFPFVVFLVLYQVRLDDRYDSIVRSNSPIAHCDPHTTPDRPIIMFLTTPRETFLNSSERVSDSRTAGVL